MYEVAKPIALHPELRRQFLHIRAIGKRQVPAQREGGELVRHRARELILSFGEQVFLQTVHAGQGLLVEQLRGGVHRLALDRGAEGSHRVVVFKRDPPRINSRVTGITGWIFGMLRHLLS